MMIQENSLIIWSTKFRKNPELTNIDELSREHIKMGAQFDAEMALLNLSCNFQVPTSGLELCGESFLWAHMNEIESWQCGSSTTSSFPAGPGSFPPVTLAMWVWTSRTPWPVTLGSFPALQSTAKDRLQPQEHWKWQVSLFCLFFAAPCAEWFPPEKFH